MATKIKNEKTTSLSTNKRVRGKAIKAVFLGSSSLCDINSFSSVLYNGLTYKLKQRAKNENSFDFLHIIQTNDSNSVYPQFVCFLSKKTGFDVNRINTFFESVLAQGCELVELQTILIEKAVAFSYHFEVKNSPKEQFFWGERFLV